MRLPDYKEARTRDKRDYKRVEFSFEDSIKGKYTGKTLTFHLKYNDGNYNLIKIEE